MENAHAHPAGLSEGSRFFASAKIAPLLKASDEGVKWPIKPRGYRLGKDRYYRKGTDPGIGKVNDWIALWYGDTSDLYVQELSIALVLCMPLIMDLALRGSLFQVE